MTQNNLGNTLRILGERESRTGLLEEAVAAYRAALEEYTPERVPLDWAGSFGNQGVAMMLIADRTDGRRACGDRGVGRSRPPMRRCATAATRLGRQASRRNYPRRRRSATGSRASEGRY